MWMSDKPLIQEQCAEDISHLMDCLEFDQAMLFFKIGLITLQNEWNGIDYLRLDKFLMFVRRLLRRAFFVLKEYNFKKQRNEVFAHVLEETILSQSKIPALGLFMHFTEIYLEELAKVADGKLHPSRTKDLLMPFFRKFAFTSEFRVFSSIGSNIFSHLMQQHRLGQEFSERYEIWKSRGFKGSINQIQKVNVSDSDSSQEEEAPTERPMDPRAGRVDVVLPEILFDAKEISEILLTLKTNPKTNRSTRNFLGSWAEKFLRLYNGIYPIGPKKLISKQDLLLGKLNVKQAVKRLNQFEEMLLARDKQTKKRKRESFESQYIELNEPSKKRKKKKIVSDNEEAIISSPKQKKKDKTLTKNLTERENMVKKSKLKKGKKLGETAGVIATQKLKKKLKVKKKQALQKNVKETVKIDEPKMSVNNDIVDEYNFCFERNSGVWCVSPKSYPTKEGFPKGMSKKINIIKEGDILLDMTSIKSEKKKKKRKKSKEVEENFNQLRGKSRTSKNKQSSSIVQVSSKKQQKFKSESPKKVVINTKLNVSQEIDDHIWQVKASPKVPWDSSKKPGKPLLKPHANASPINPFYKLRKF